MCIRGPRILLIGMALVALLAGVTAPPAWGADPQPYGVHFNSTGNGALNALLRASSQLDSLRKTAPVGPFALVDRAQQDIGRLQSALQSFGYYRSRALISIEGRSLNDPTLPDLLAALPKDRAAKIELRFELGPLFHLGNITVAGAVSPGARAALKLKEGDPAVAQTVLDARQRLLTQLEEEGHAYAGVDEPVATLRDADLTLDVGFTATPGPVYTLGAISFEGLKLVKEPFVRRQLTIHVGDAYRASAVEQAREALLNLGVFAAVSVRLPPRGQVAGTELPITFVLAERKRHAVTLSGEYSSDLGVVAGVGWTDRNVFGRADQLTISGNIFGLGGNGTATNGVSYDATAQLTIPDFYAPTQSMQFELQFLKPELTAYSQVAAIGGATLSRKLSSVWTVSAGVSLEEERIEQSEIAKNCDEVSALAPPQWCFYTLLSAPLSAHYDSTDLVNPLLDPLHGLRAQLLLTPTETLHGPRATFLIMQANASSYLDLNKLGWTQPGQSVIAVRALIGQALGASQFSLPPDLRFYAGGSATVRGYAYQALGPTFPPPDAVDQYPEGGTGITAAAIEFRQRVWGNFGLAVFMDGGAVATSRVIGSGAWGFGYGGGPRYYTPIGPIRLDVAFPLQRPNGADAFEAYIGIGQAF
jgi:translocation and assembly module TamA